jgi:hypothetical protein
LNHEAVDDAVENRTVVVAVLGVLEKVLHGLRGLVRIEFHLHLAVTGFDRDHGVPFVTTFSCAGRQANGAAKRAAEYRQPLQ